MQFKFWKLIEINLHSYNIAFSIEKNQFPIYFEKSYFHYFRTKQTQKMSFFRSHTKEFFISLVVCLGLSALLAGTVFYVWDEQGRTERIDCFVFNCYVTDCRRKRDLGEPQFHELSKRDSEDCTYYVGGQIEVTYLNQTQQLSIYEILSTDISAKCPGSNFWTTCYYKPDYFEDTISFDDGVGNSWVYTGLIIFFVGGTCIFVVVVGLIALRQVFRKELLSRANEERRRKIQEMSKPKLKSTFEMRVCSRFIIRFSRLLTLQSKSSTNPRALLIWSILVRSLSPHFGKLNVLVVEKCLEYAQNKKTLHQVKKQNGNQFIKQLIEQNTKTFEKQTLSGKRIGSPTDPEIHDLV